MICSFISCTSSKKENVKQEENIGQYLYLDQYNCLHTNKNCIMLLIGGETENTSHTNYPVNFIEVEQIRNLTGFKFCSDCFTDKLYKTLQNMVDDNKQLQNQDTLAISKELQDEIEEDLKDVQRIQ